MKIHWTRRDFLSVTESLAVAGLLPGAAVRSVLENAQAPTSLNNVPNNGTNPVAEQMMADIVKAGTDAINAASSSNIQYIINHPIYNGPEISANYAPPRPYIPVPKNEFDFEGPLPEDFPPDYMNFDPQTGLFDNILID